jgi:spore coat polysaccharide biosynthesis protein SpsF
MLAIVQARMNSTRLPGKVLRRLAGKPMLSWTLARIRASKSIDRAVIATSGDRTDDPIAAFCTAEGITCHRGPLDNVALRMAGAARAEAAGAFVRVNGDSPLIDPEIMDRAVALYQVVECDLVTNVFVRSFPKGQSVEVLRTTTFLAACEGTMDPDDCEHVTRIYYRSPERYRIIAFTSGVAAAGIQLSVDTHDDFSAVAGILTASGNNVPGWRELVAMKESAAV